MASVHDFEMTRLNGVPEKLDTYKGKILLIVNLASRCGFTPQYQGLESLYRDLKDRGFEILGFPCNQFGSQEPGSLDEIADFCKVNYGVTFPLFEKIDVNGSGAPPLFDYLKNAAPGLLQTEAIKWNFTKFVVDRNGQAVKRFAPKDTPEKIRPFLTAMLDKD